MSSLIQKIENKINKQAEIPNLISRINSMLLNQRNILDDNDIQALENEKLKLKSELIEDKQLLEEKHKSFFYTYDEIENAPEISWLIPNLIPNQSIGVLIGASGVGKTTFVINSCQKILKSHLDVFIVYIDGDMSGNKIKEMGVAELMQKYESRFIYAGKTSDDFSDSAQKLLRDIVIEQEKYPKRRYFVIEDSLTLVARKKRGFIDTDFLYKHERALRSLGGACLVILHKNKAGIFADSQQIVNYADYTFEIERNEFNACIILHPQKASRFDITGKAFLTEDRRITKEVDYESVNLNFRESQFVHYVVDALEDGEMNQSELIAHLEKMRFFSEFKVGQKKVIKWLQNWGDKGKWSYEKRPNEKNAIFFWLEIVNQTEKVAKLPNNELKEL